MSADFVFSLISSQTDTPPTGTSSIYFKTDGNPYTMNSSGTESSLVGATGSTGAAGEGVPTGGTVGQILTKNSSTNYDASWLAPLGPQQVSLTGPGTLGSIAQSVEVNSSSPCTVTLPAANGMIASVGGNQYCLPIVIFNTGTGVLTIAANGADTINGAATASLQFQWSSIELRPNYAGTGWMIV